MRLLLHSEAEHAAMMSSSQPPGVPMVHRHGTLEGHVLPGVMFIVWGAQHTQAALARPGCAAERYSLSCRPLVEPPRLPPLPRRLRARRPSVPSSALLPGLRRELAALLAHAHRTRYQAALRRRGHHRRGLPLRPALHGAGSAEPRRDPRVRRRCQSQRPTDVPPVLARR